MKNKLIAAVTLIIFLSQSVFAIEDAAVKLEKPKKAKKS